MVCLSLLRAFTRIFLRNSLEINTPGVVVIRKPGDKKSSTQKGPEGARSRGEREAELKENYSITPFQKDLKQQELRIHLRPRLDLGH